MTTSLNSKHKSLKKISKRNKNPNKIDFQNNISPTFIQSANRSKFKEIVKNTRTKIKTRQETNCSSESTILFSKFGRSYLGMVLKEFSKIGGCFKSSGIGDLLDTKVGIHQESF